MLRNRARAVTSKQALMADQSSQSSSHQKQTKPIPSFFVSPRFRAFTTKGAVSETNTLISPTSILEAKAFPHFGNPFACDRSQPKSPDIISRQKKGSDVKEIGLALVNTLNDRITRNTSSKPSRGTVLFSATIRVEVTPLPENSSVQTNDTPAVFTECISAREMELSEEYTRVTSHGPNPRTTHIFNNLIVGSGLTVSDKSRNFLSFCHTCHRNLEQKDDIYIYRGEKWFCSHECRNKEMMLDGLEISYIDELM